MDRILVIGYGNPLRSDDGVGQEVARAVAAWGLPGVKALAVHQLTPELTDWLAEVDRVILVDAAATEGEGIQLRSLQPAGMPATFGHTSSPEWLLALTEALYGRYPSAWLLTIPAACFELGETLSTTARRGKEQALIHLATTLR